MFFLLRVAFWLTVVLVLLPSGEPKQDIHRANSSANLGATEAVVAAGAAVSDMSGFCERQAEACKVGAQAAEVIGQRAQAGARMVYDFISERMTKDHNAPGATGSVNANRTAGAQSKPAFPGSQTTLTPADLMPNWQGDTNGTKSVPLPRPRQEHHRRA